MKGIHKALALRELTHSPVGGLIHSIPKEELLLIPGNFMMLEDVPEWSWELSATFPSQRDSPIGDMFVVAS